MKALPYKEPFYITQEYMNVNPIYKPHGRHMALDLQRKNRKGEINIYAVNDGIVVFASVAGAYGRSVVIESKDPELGTIYTRYSHLEKIFVVPYETVKAGITVIGLEGCTGLSVGGGDTRHLDLRISKKREHSSFMNDYFDISNYLNLPNKRVLVDPTKINLGGEIMNIVFYQGGSDMVLADRVAQKVGGVIAPRTDREKYPDCIPYIVGGVREAGAVNICGKDFNETCLEYLKFMGVVK